MVNLHLTGAGTPWMGSSTPTSTPTYGGSYGREEQAFQGELAVSYGGYDPGHDSDAGQYADEVIGNDINTVIGSQVTMDTTPASTKPNSVFNYYGKEIDLTNISDDIWNLAKQAADPATNPGYALSYEGKKLKAAGIEPGSDRWVMHFGLSQIVQTGETYMDEYGQEIHGKPSLTKEYTGEYGQLIQSPSGEPILTGQGQYLMDQYDDPTGSYQEQVDAYYKMREAEQAQQTGGDPNYGYGYGPGGGGTAGGGGYALGVKGFHRARPENISPWARNIAGTPMLPVAGSGAGASMASADELYALASGKKAFSMTPEEQGILALLNA